MFEISPELRAVYPDVFAIALRVSRLRPEVLQQIDPDLPGSAEAVRKQLPAGGDIADLPAVRVWRDAYALAGVKPSKFRSSIEALVRRAAKGEMPTVIPLVDIYNSISMRRMVPLGAADADLVSGPIVLRLCDPATDSFEPLGAKASDYPLRSTVPVYASSASILCWCFNSRDSALTALGPATTDAYFFTEGVAAWQLPPALRAIDELGNRLADAGADISIHRFV